MAMSPGMKMMMIQRTAQDRSRNQNQSEYGNQTGRRMIGYDRDEMQNRQRSANGRYMAGDGWDNPPLAAEYDERKYGMGGYNTESRRRRDSRGRYMMDGMDYDEDEPRSYQSRMKGGNSFGDIYADVYAPGAQNRPNGMQGGHSHHDDMERPVDEHTAHEWVRKMQAADGSRGGKFKPEQAEQLRATNCPECKRWEFYVAINMMYADYCEVAKKLNVDRADFYACMAKAFLCDEDAGENKLRKYMETIPE